MSDEANIAAYRDTFNLLCGNVIGRGSARVVYDSQLFPEHVIKVENVAGRFQNVMEWETWLIVRDTKWAKWFAPCKWISPAGVVLIQAKTTPPPRASYPEMMPKFFADFKRPNYGLLNEQIVCHDYGVHLLMENGMSDRMKKVEWWDE